MSAVWIADDEIVRVTERRTVKGGRRAGRMSGAVLMTAGTLLAAWLLETRLGAIPETMVPAPHRAPAPLPASAPFEAALLDPGTQFGLAPVAFGQAAPLEPRFASAAPELPPAPIAAVMVEPVPPAETTLGDDDAMVPLPVARPPGLRPLAMPPPVRSAGRHGMRPPLVPQATPPDNRTFFEKLFGGAAQPPGPALAYAPPDGGLFGGGFVTGSPRGTAAAVYDIAAHTVTLPDGTRLEAHSGLGELLDDPRHVAQRNRGATPPHVYDLEPRAALFHGVRALRLNPVGGGGVFGRTGLLAHSYMLGPNGQSNGCVSFKEYDRFLEAFLRGDVRRLVVVGG